MKTWKNIFVKFLSLTIVGLLCVCGAHAAAVDESCDNNDYVTPELALCSTHAYNISMTTNPENDADKALMRDVIAMKTTVITQQMYKQYEQMESMLRRLKTQLQKAILTNDLKVASGDAGDGDSGSYRSDDKYRVLMGTNNCNLQSSEKDAISCLQTNVRIVLEALGAGNTSDARKQLEKDLGTAKTWGVITDNTFNDECKKVYVEKSSKKKDDVNACAQGLLVKLAQYTKTLSQNDAMMKMIQKQFQ